MRCIESLKPNATRDRALIQLRGQGIGRAARRILLGPLRCIADVYVPFHLFSVNIQGTGQQQNAMVAIDALCGCFDLYSFQSVPTGQLVQVRTRNRPEANLSEQHARDLVIDRLRRLEFRRGFFRIRELRISAEPIRIGLHIPYWIAFFGSSDRVQLTVLDAVRCRIEGAKVRHYLCDWLTKSSGPSHNI